MQTEQQDTFEPADRPVRFYETGLCALAQLLYFLWQSIGNQGLRLGAAAATALLIGMSLWKLLLPPRFSATRGAFVVIGLFRVVLLVPALR